MTCAVRFQEPVAPNRTDQLRARTSAKVDAIVCKREIDKIHQTQPCKSHKLSCDLLILPLRVKMTVEL